MMIIGLDMMINITINSQYKRPPGYGGLLLINWYAY
jgi:hypothetical protein